LGSFCHFAVPPFSSQAPLLAQSWPAWPPPKPSIEIIYVSSFVLLGGLALVSAGVKAAEAVH
jgi:hypothetical protein